MTQHVPLAPVSSFHYLHTYCQMQTVRGRKDEDMQDEDMQSLLVNLMLANYSLILLFNSKRNTKVSDSVLKNDSHEELSVGHCISSSESYQYRPVSLSVPPPV